MASCKDLGKFDQDGVCVSSCKRLYVENGNEQTCIRTCPGDRAFVLSADDPKCTTCSLFRYNERLDRVCVSECGEGEERVKLNDTAEYCQRPEEKCDHFVSLVDG